jgi:DNA repair exonuclease SbcCD ATPase subunit
MILLKEIQLINFLSHKESKLEFTDNQKLLIDGKSGAGKSSIVEAILWALYGKSRSDNRSIIRVGKPKARVVLTLSDDNKFYRIERTTDKKGKQSISLLQSDDCDKWKQVEVTGVKNIQQHIENDILHSSYSLFINSIVYPQDNSDNFIKQSASKRKDLLMEIAKAGDYDEHLKKTKQLIREKEDGFLETQSKIDVIEQMVETMSKELIDVKGLQEEQKENNNNLKKVKAEIEKTEQELNNYKLLEDKKSQLKNEQREKRDDLKKSESSLIEINREIEELKNVNIDELEKQITNTDGLKNSLKSMRSIAQKERDWQNLYNATLLGKPSDYDYESEISQLNKKVIEIVNREQTICPELKKPCCIEKEKKQQDINYFTDILNTKLSEQNEYKKQCEDYDNKLKALGEKPQVDYTAIDDLEREIEKQTSSNSEIKDRMANVAIRLKEKEIRQKELEVETKDRTDKLKVIDEKLKEFEKQSDADNDDVLILWHKQKEELKKVETRNTEIEITLKSDEETKVKIKDYKDKIKKEKDKYLNNKEDLESLKLLKDAFGNNGIKAMIIDNIVPILEDKINNILSQLSDFRVRIETQKSNVTTDTVSEGLYINIYNEQSELIDFANYSGGEKLKIVVAISEALSEIQNIGFRVLDELFIGLDDESTDKFAEIMTSLQDRLKQLVCVSHLNSIKNLFNERIDVVKQHGVSKIL